MKRKTIIISFITLSVLFIIAGILGWMKWKMYNPPKNGHTRHWKFLYATDYSKLRDSCIQVIKHRHSYRLPKWRRNSPVNPEDPIFIDPKDESLPESLRKLNPSMIIVTKCRLVAHFHHGPPMCCHHGFVVFLDENDIDDIELTEEGKKIIVGRMAVDDKLLLPNNNLWLKVIPNLWYFDVWFENNGHCQQPRKEVKAILQEQVKKQNDY